MAESPPTTRVIDVWDVNTFDCELRANLAENSDLIRNYFAIENQIFLTDDLRRGNERFVVRPENRYSCAFHALEAAIGRQMETRAIRAWHYTRLTRAEVERLRREGIHLSRPSTLRARLEEVVSSGAINAQAAEAIYARSLFHGEQLDARSDKFWMTSHPVALDDGGVKVLLDFWGGEVAWKGLRNSGLLAILANIGEPCIIEVAVPLALSRHSTWAGRAVVATFGRTLGCIQSKQSFDLYVTAPLPKEWVLEVHRKCDCSFQTIACGYPADYVDIDNGYWKELTSEGD